MKPPYCHFCHRPLGSPTPGGEPQDGLVEFADYVPLQGGMVGHPRGLEWFCAEHFAAARRLSGRTTAEAMAAMRR